MDLSIVVPCLNEERGLQRLHEALGAVLPEIAQRYEIILVDDGSEDGTLVRAQQLCMKDAAVHYVALSRLTTLDGLYLTRPLIPGDVIVDPDVRRWVEDRRRAAATG